MGRVVSFLLCCVLAFVPFRLQTTQAEELPEVIDRVKQSVVIINAIDRDGRPFATGSGFAVAPSIIATNVHVLEDGHKFKITRSDGRTCVATGIWAYDELHDVALVQVSDPEKNGKFDPLPLASDEEIRVGVPILIVGHPKSLKFTVTSGIVSSTERRLNEIEKEAPKAAVIQSDAATAAGSSGGCWITQSGKVVGVHRAGMVALQGFNFATHVSHLRTLLNRDREKMLPTDHFAKADRIGRNWKVVIPPNVPKEKPLYSSLDNLTMDDGGNGKTNTISNYTIDGEFMWTMGGVERVGGKSAAMSFGKFDDFTFEAAAEYGREGGSFFLVGWKDNSGYILSDCQLRTSATWYLTEIRDGVILTNTGKLISERLRTTGRSNIRIAVSDKELSFDIGSNSILKAYKLPNYNGGSLIWGTLNLQYGPRPLKIFAARIRAS